MGATSVPVVVRRRGGTHLTPRINLRHRSACRARPTQVLELPCLCSAGEPPFGTTRDTLRAKFVDASVIWSHYKELPGGCVVLEERASGAI